MFEPDSPFQRFERIDERTARGPGIIDMKGGDVVMIHALKALHAVKALDRLRVTVVMTGDEELTGEPLPVARAALIEAAKGADVAIGFEDGPGDPKTAVIARRGTTGWQLRVKAKPAHSSQIFREDIGSGAIYEAARILTGFRETLGGEPHLTFNPGVILGGTAVDLDPALARGTAAGKENVVAAQAVVMGDLRTLSVDQLERAKERMQKIVAAPLPHAESTLTFEEGYPPLSPSPGNERLLALYDQASRDVGAGPVTAVNPDRAGAADVSFVAGQVKMIIDGVGLMGNSDHTPQETADLTTLPSQTKRAALLAVPDRQRRSELPDCRSRDCLGYRLDLQRGPCPTTYNPRAMTTPVVIFDAIEKAYGQTVALRGVSFDVNGGEIFGLLGPNGAGKSTLIRILMDIIRADRGQVMVFGEPRRRDHLDRLGYLPEERGLYTKLAVIDVMTYFGALKGLSRAEAKRRSLAWLEKVELPHVATWKVDRLSKGMSQKVQIASILLSDPEVCVLDEPTTGLDPVNVQIVQDLLLERRRNGRTTILSTHHMNQVEELCDRVALINQGQLMVYGGVDEVRRRYSLPEIRVHARGPLPTVPAVERITDEGEGSWRILLSDGTPPHQVLAALVASGAAVDRFEPLLAPMEDIFVRVVREGRA